MYVRASLKCMVHIWIALQLRIQRSDWGVRNAQVVFLNQTGFLFAMYVSGPFPRIFIEARLDCNGTTIYLIFPEGLLGNICHGNYFFKCHIFEDKSRLKGLQTVTFRLAPNNWTEGLRKEGVQSSIIREWATVEGGRPWISYWQTRWMQVKDIQYRRTGKEKRQVVWDRKYCCSLATLYVVLVC